MDVETKIDAMQWVSDTSMPKCNRKMQASATKEKCPSNEDLDRLRGWLTLHNTEAATFMNAALLSGLRPTEWRTANLTYVGDRAVLFVKNAKATNGRAHGTHRKLWFDALTFQQVQAIRNTISMFVNIASRAEYDALLERLQRAFRHAAMALWPRRKRHITPYSLRHAFAARIKLVYQPEEVAALMGHAVDETAFSHYGRRRKKSARDQGLTLPKADHGDVARVKQRQGKNLERFASAKIASNTLVSELSLLKLPNEEIIKITHK
jgi:hypothetical protein